VNKMVSKILSWLFPLPKEIFAPVWMKTGSIMRIKKINNKRWLNSISLDGVKFDMKGKI